MTCTVRMDFADGTFHLIEVDADDPREAEKLAREWVEDNAFYTAEEDE